MRKHRETKRITIDITLATFSKPYVLHGKKWTEDNH